MLFLKNKKPSWARNANWAVPVLAEFVKRPQAELKSARLACQRASDDTERAVKSQSVVSAAPGWAGKRRGFLRVEC
jgi:hypothetical protein